MLGAIFRYAYSLRDFFFLKKDDFASAVKADLFIDEARNRTTRLNTTAIVQEKD